MEKELENFEICKNENIELKSNLKIAQENAILLQKELDTLKISYEALKRETVLQTKNDTNS